VKPVTPKQKAAQASPQTQEELTRLLNIFSPPLATAAQERSEQCSFGHRTWSLRPRAKVVMNRAQTATLGPATLGAHGICWRRKYNAKSGPIDQRPAAYPKRWHDSRNREVSWPRAFGFLTMKPKVTVEVTVDVAKCLRAIALILFVILV
jgi:hypothetical protein